MTLQDCMFVTDAAYLSYMNQFMPNMAFIANMIDPSHVCWNTETERWEPKSALLRGVMNNSQKDSHHQMVEQWLEENEGIPDVGEQIEDVTNWWDRNPCFPLKLPFLKAKCGHLLIIGVAIVGLGILSTVFRR